VKIWCVIIVDIFVVLCCVMWCKIKINNICNVGQINILEPYSSYCSP
jgi:hypothetical protein